MNDKNRLLTHLDSCGLGLLRKTVALVPFNISWPEAFSFLKQQITKIIPINISIEHIGSTALPNCSAKPILDVLIWIERPEDKDSLITGLEQLGFMFRGEYGFPGRHYFVLRSEDQSTEYVHIHAFLKGHQEAQKLIDFRDRLLASPQLVSSYQKLKKDLKESGFSREEYTPAKGDFIQKVLEKIEHG